MKEKIAVLTDSGSNVSTLNNPNLFILPLLILIDGKTYVDGIDINLQEVLNVLDQHKITTSLPSAHVIEETLNDIKELGYTHVIVNTISSGLSGTYNIVRLLTEAFAGLEIALFDTKNISIGSGFTTIAALELIEQGKSFAEIVPLLREQMVNNKVFFTIKSLDYLRRGGRIGLITKVVADIMNLKPIISCNKEGVYYSVKKVRGYQKAINRALELAYDFAESAKTYDITILVTRMEETTNQLKKIVESKFLNVDKLEVITVTPALAIHIGPESFGIAVRKKD